MVTPWLWAVFTVIAAFSQTVRNAMQRELTATLGTVGATHVRFLFGFPFVLVFLIGVMVVSGTPLPRPDAVFWPWVILGAGAQVAATALMLAAMGERSFVVTIAYIKTEPIQVAIFGLVFLGDLLTLPMMTAIVVATSGVVIMSTKPGGMVGGIKPTLIGLASGGMFALSAIGFRGAILKLGLSNYVMAATFTLAAGIVSAGGTAVTLSRAAQSGCIVRHHPRLETLVVRRSCRRGRFAVLVPGICARHRGQRAHAGADRGPVRATDRPFCFRPAHQRPRSGGHGACRRRRGVAAMGVLRFRCAKQPESRFS